MRTVLAAAAAGALILGSAAGAMAAPATKGKPVKDPYVKIQTIDLHRHSPINVDSVSTARDLKFSVVIRDKDSTATVTKVTVTLAQYDAKSSVSPTVVTAPAKTLTLTGDSTSVKNRKNSSTFKGVFTKEQLVALGVTEGTTARMCISAVTPDITDTDGTETVVTKSTQTVRRLGEGTKKPVRECVRLVNPLTVAPANPA
jgi:hypothetical protein